MFGGNNPCVTTKMLNPLFNFGGKLPGTLYFVHGTRCFRGHSFREALDEREAIVRRRKCIYETLHPKKTGAPRLHPD